ncbi:MAG: hypothetical protein R3E08_00785 [Thiotrichaceae bacterium]
MINTPLTQTISLTENGNSDLIINSATISDARCAAFKVTSPTAFPVTLTDGATTPQTITVSCTPTTAVPLTATILQLAQ